MDKTAMKQRLNAYFSEHHEQIRSDILKLLGEMVAQRTINVPTDKLSQFDFLRIRGEEWRVGDIVKRTFDQWDIPYTVYEKMPGRPNIIGQVGKGKDKDKILFAACHMDIVPPGPGWDTDPFVMTEKDGKVYGRGVLDNKGPLASSMVAAHILKTVIGDTAIEGALQVSALSDEEAADPDGEDYGIHYLMEEKHIHPSFAIIPDIGENMKKIDIAEKGRVVVRIKAKGVQAHASTPHLGVNAIHKMARFLTLLEHYTPKHTPDPILGSPTFNAGEIHGGAAANIVPSECSVDIDLRLVPGQTPEGVADELSALTEQVDGDFEVVLKDASKPHAIDLNNILVQSIQKNAEMFDLHPEPFGLGGGTFAKGMNEHGILAVGFGPGDETAFHVANEYVEIQQLIIFAHLICLIAVDLTV